MCATDSDRATNSLMSSRPSRASLFGVLDTVATLLTVVSAVAAVAVFLYPVGIAEDRLIQQPVADVTDVTSLPRHVTGLSSARVVLMEFSDFSCEFCQRHQRDSHESSRVGSRELR